MKGDLGTGLIPERVQNLFGDMDKKSVDRRCHRASSIRRIMEKDATFSGKK
jgi:hypothetical protein